MDSLFSKVLIINMDGEETRYADVARRLKGTGTSSFYRIPAVDGRQLSDGDKKALCNGYCRAVCTPSMIGCFLSHKKAWAQCVEEGLPSVLVLEDDCLFTKDAVKGAQTAVGELPLDWHICMLGCFTCSDDDITAEDASIARMLYPTRSPEQVTEHLWKPSMIFGMHAYAVSNAGARRLLQLMPRASNHVDWELSRHIDELNIFALRPGVAFQTAMDTSSMGTKAPVFLNKLLSHVQLGSHPQDGRTLAWLFSEGWFKLGWQGLVVNKWFIIFLVASMMGYPKVCFAVLLVDLLISLATSKKIAKSFWLGYSTLTMTVIVGGMFHVLLLQARSYGPRALSQNGF